MRSSRLLVLLLLSVACATTSGGTPRQVDLRELDGTPVSLQTGYFDATVLLFWSTGCPCVARYRERMAALRDRWGAEGVQVLAISSNVDDDLEALRRADPPLRLLVDEDGRLARQVGARSTPTAVVLDRAGQVRFLGWIDNERLPGDPARQAWLDEALEGLLREGEVGRQRTPTWGCAITRSLGERLRCQPVENVGEMP